MLGNTDLLQLMVFQVLLITSLLENVSKLQGLPDKNDLNHCHVTETLDNFNRRSSRGRPFLFE